MAGRIPEQFIEDVLARVDIVDLIETYVPLRKTGRDFQARCPFHTEKSPSFTVSPTKQFFHCFGCGVGGDVIAFLMKIDHLSFTESVEKLADKMGYTLRYDGSGGATSGVNRSRLVAANTAATKFYQDELNKPGAAQVGRDFLQKRGFDKSAAESFGVGFAPDEWDALYKNLKGQGFTDQELSIAGLDRKSVV